MQRLAQWDELRERGQVVTAIDLCKDAPELSSELQRQIDQLKAMDWLDDPSGESPQPAEWPESEFDDESRTGELHIPPILGGRYELESLMAEGGFAQVWRAMDVTLQRPVAVKVTRVNCYAEARRVAQLKHHGIVTVHDVGNTDGLCFIVFDLVEGTTLAEKICRGPFHPQTSAAILMEVAKSLQFAHDKGFIHRDLKPANILLDHNQTPILADFGIAVTECELRHEAMTSVGTLAYMAPEQLRVDGVIDARTDVYGLGVVFYEMLTGTLPFSYPTLSGLREQILAGNPQSPRALNPAIPEAYERICLQCLSTDKDGRFQSAIILAEALRRNLE